MNNLAQESKISIPDGNGQKDRWSLCQGLSSVPEDKYLQNRDVIDADLAE